MFTKEQKEDILKSFLITVALISSFAIPALKTEMDELKKEVEVCKATKQELEILQMDIPGICSYMNISGKEE